MLRYERRVRSCQEDFALTGRFPPKNEGAVVDFRCPARNPVAKVSRHVRSIRHVCMVSGDRSESAEVTRPGMARVDLVRGGPEASGAGLGEIRTFEEGA
jgi:hypothetical protein